jgi:hypothetical protein
MLKLLEKVLPRLSHPPQPLATVRSIRPSLLDLRFTGDPWVVGNEDGTASICLDNYLLTNVQTLPFDVPSLNHLLLQLRQWQMRRRLYRRLRAHPSASCAAPSAILRRSGGASADPVMSHQQAGPERQRHQQNHHNR